MPVKQEKLRPQERPAPAPALRKVQFGSIAKKKPEGRASYPLLPDPQGQYAAIAARIIDRSAQVEALAGALDLDKAELKTLATPFYFTNGQGKLDVPSSVAVPCPSGQVLITYQNRYGKLESEEPLAAHPGPADRALLPPGVHPGDRRGQTPRRTDSGAPGGTPGTLRQVPGQ